MCLGKCSCEIAAKAFKEVPSGLQHWLDHLQSVWYCSPGKRMQRTNSIELMRGFVNQKLKGEKVETLYRLAHIGHFGCGALNTFRGGHKQFFNGYCPFPPNLVNKF